MDGERGGDTLILLCRPRTWCGAGAVGGVAASKVSGLVSKRTGAAATARSNTDAVVGAVLKGGCRIVPVRGRRRFVDADGEMGVTASISAPSDGTSPKQPKTRKRLANQAPNQPTNEPTNQRTNQPTNQQTNKPTNKHKKQTNKAHQITLWQRMTIPEPKRLPRTIMPTYAGIE